MSVLRRPLYTINDDGLAGPPACLDLQPELLKCAVERFHDGQARVGGSFRFVLSLVAIIHFNDRHSIWIQETYYKIVSIPWYTTTSIGYTRSW